MRIKTRRDALIDLDGTGCAGITSSCDVDSVCIDVDLTWLIAKCSNDEIGIVPVSAIALALASGARVDLGEM